MPDITANIPPWWVGEEIHCTQCGTVYRLLPEDAPSWPFEHKLSEKHITVKCPECKRENTLVRQPQIMFLEPNNDQEDDE